MTDRFCRDGFPPVESDSPQYWQVLNEMGKRGELPERIWPKRGEDD